MQGIVVLGTLIVVLQGIFSFFSNSVLSALCETINPTL